MRRDRSIRWSVAVLVAALALATGCSDTCTCPDDADETSYPDQSTPDNVIEKLEMAYEDMDADADMECLAEDFMFSLNPDDLAADPTLPEYWDKQDEEVIHRHMFADTTIIESIVLTLTVVSTDSLPGEDPNDPTDDLWEYEVDVDLRVQSGLTYLSTGRSLFVMRRSPDRDDVVWQIIEHHDLGDEPLGAEDTTWTAIKLAFGGPVADSLYPTRSNPENVLLKLELAYERMDAEAYLDCLAEGFLFYLNIDDLTADPSLPEHWDKAEETAIHVNMFGEGEPHVERITLLMDVASEEHDPGPDPIDPSDDRWIYEEETYLLVWLPLDLALRADNPQEFVIGVEQEETGHAGELLWKIVEWHDLSPWQGEAPGRESCSWGAIKALFR